MTLQTVRARILELLAQRLGDDSAATLGPDEPIAAVGIDSLDLVVVLTVLEGEQGRSLELPEVPPGALTLDLLAASLASQLDRKG